MDVYQPRKGINRNGSDERADTGTIFKKAARKIICEVEITTIAINPGYNNLERARNDLEWPNDYIYNMI